MIRNFSNILLLLLALLVQMPAWAVDSSGNPFIVKRGSGSQSQTVMSGDTIKPFYYEYISEVFIDHVQVPDAMFKVDHDKKNRAIYLSGVAGGPTASYDVRIWGLVTNDTLKKWRVTRSGVLTVLRPHLDYKKDTVFKTDTETILDTIKIGYTKFTQSVWTSELPYGMKLVKGDDHCELVSTEVLPTGSYKFKVYGADSLYYSKDSIIVTDVHDGKGTKLDTMKFHPKRYCDSLEFTVNVFEGGLMKIGTGGTKQVVELGDSIETFGFEWGVTGKLTTEAIIPGLEMVIDSTKQNIWIQGVPTELGLQEFDIAYETKSSFIVYNIEVSVLPDIRPIIEVVDEYTLKQVVSIGEMIDDIQISYYNSDSVWVEGIPEGIISEINKEDGEILIYGALRESGTYDIKVHARNAKYESELAISISTSDKSGDATGIDDVIATDEEKIVTYDMLGRRVSPEKMGNKSVFTIKKKIVIRK